MNYRHKRYIGKDMQTASARLRSAHRMQKKGWRSDRHSLHYQTQHNSNRIYAVIVVVLLVFILAGAAFSYQNVRALVMQGQTQAARLEKIIGLEL